MLSWRGRKAGRCGIGDREAMSKSGSATRRRRDRLRLPTVLCLDCVVIDSLRTLSTARELNLGPSPVHTEERFSILWEL